MKNRAFYLLFFLLTITTLQAVNYYASPTGTSTAAGTLASPYNITTAISKAVAGDSVILRGGTYSLATKISLTKSGTSGSFISLIAYYGDSSRPVLDFSGETRYSSSSRGIELKGNYWYLYKIDIQNAGDNGLYIGGSYNTIEFCTVSLNQDSGMQLSGGASNNLIKNCDSFYNADQLQGNADGFSIKMDVGSGNHLIGCRSYNNSDDGYDGYLRGADEINTLVENCWAFHNGYLKDNTAGSGDGNGFKTGGYDAVTPPAPKAHNMTLTNCISSTNKVNGFDRNSNVGNITILNCSSHKNGGNDYSFPGGKDPNQKAGHIIKIKNSLKIGSTPSFSDTPLDITNNSWQNGLSCTAADFQSLDYTQLYLARKANGDLPEITYLKLVATSSLIDKGIDVGLPYIGSAPDLGAFEYGVTTGISVPTSDGSGIQIYYSGESRTINIQGQCTAVDVFTITGKKILSRQITTNELSISTANWIKGIYLVHTIFQNGTSETKKIIIA